MDSGPAWLKLSTECAPPLAERLAEALEALDAVSVSLGDAADGPDSALLAEADEHPGLWARTRVEALFAADTDVPALRAALAAHLPGLALPEFGLERLIERDWVAVTREAVEPRCYGAGLWVCPTWSVPPAEAAACLRLDPGLAFGTGAHATTALCLEWLADAPALAGARVLDYGCGSGILALAALALGVREAWGVDIDAQALVVARDNALANGLAEGFRSCLPEALAPDERFDVLLANILLQPLLGLAPTLAGHLRPGGRLVLSGLLESQAELCRARYAAWFDFAPARVSEGWALLEARRKAVTVGPDAGAEVARAVSPGAAPRRHAP